MNALAVTDAERRLFGVHTERGELRLRPTGWSQLGSGAQMAVAGAFFVLLNKLGSGRQVLLGLAVAFVVGVWGLLLWAGTVFVTPEGLRVWWFGVHRIPWDEVESFGVSTRAPAWASGWPPFEVVGVRLRTGRSVTLWPTRSTAVPAAGAANAASAHCGLLERYRATLPG